MDSIPFKLFMQSFPSIFFLFLILTLLRFSYLFTTHQKIDLNHEIKWGFFNFWIATIISLTMLSEIHISLQGISIHSSELTGINLKLFRIFKEIQIITFKNGYWPYFWINLIGNLILFIPFGFLLPVLFKRCSFFKVLFSSFIFSFLIEIIQLFLPRGTDVDDVWLNCLGGIIGWFLFQYTNKIKKIN